MIQPSPTPTPREKHASATGFALLALGALLLLVQLTGHGVLVLPLLVLLFLGLGAWQREAGWLIPAGILGGVSLGALLPGHLFLLGFALGWFSIPLLTRFLSGETHWWAVVPGSVMALAGLSSFGWPLAETLLRGLSLLWPLALVAVGGYLVLRTQRAS